MALVRALLAAGAACMMVGALPWTASGADGRVHLPTVADALPFAPGSEGILNGSQGVETQLPGPVVDREAVRVDLSTDGSVDAIAVTQRLTLSGLGDFSFKVAGPASDVQALPESANQPGLRRGAVLWQGFSPGTKLLAARMTLFPDQEASRLPVRFDLSMTAGGSPLSTGERRSGPLLLTLHVSNVSAVPISMVDAPADPAEMAPVLDTLHSVLARGRRPVPGRDGIPGDVASTGPPEVRTEQVEAPFRVAVRVVFPPGTLTHPAVTGGTVASSGSDGVQVRFERLLGGGSPLDATLVIRGQARQLGLPGLTATAAPSPPRAAVVKPPTPAGWTAAVAASPEAFEGDVMLAQAMSALWRVARLGQFDAYVGNPDPLGDSATTYAFRLAPRAAPQSGVAAFGGPVRPLGVLTLAAFVVLLLFGGALLWSRS